MDRIPFSVYDFFAFVGSGLLCLVTIDGVLGEDWILGGNIGLAEFVLWLGAAYIIGQIVTTPATWLLQGRILGPHFNLPTVNLLSDQPPIGWRSHFFRGYFSQLPPLVRKRVQTRAAEAGVTGTGEDLFLLAFGTVKGQTTTMARLDIWVTQYGFCRNISFLGFAGTLFIPILCLWSGNWDKLALAPLSMLVAIGMFYRFLRYFRQYSLELLVTYSSTSSNDN
jgi:hypothetical protein